jgi:hypothetical protein
VADGRGQVLPPRTRQKARERLGRRHPPWGLGSGEPSEGPLSSTVLPSGSLR